MTLVTSSENTDAATTDVQLTLSRPEAERLRVILPSLLRALADRPTATPRQREWRRKVSEVLDSLQTALSSQFHSTAE